MRLYSLEERYFSNKMKAANPLHRSLVRIYLTVTFENIYFRKKIYKCHSVNKTVVTEIGYGTLKPILKFKGNGNALCI